MCNFLWLVVLGVPASAGPSPAHAENLLPNGSFGLCGPDGSYASERVVFRDTASGTVLWKMSHNPGYNRHVYFNFPAWNADGSRLMLRSERPGDSTFWLVDADGSRWSAFGKGFRCWHPLDSRKVFTVRDTEAGGRQQVEISEADILTGKDRLLWTLPLKRSCYNFPPPSADGKKLLLAEQSTLVDGKRRSFAWLVNSDGSGQPQRIPLHLLLPHGATKRRAGIVAIHGHGQFAHDGVAGIDDTPERRAEINRFHYDYGRKLVQRGYVVAAPCLTPFGPRLGNAQFPKRADPCTLTNLKLQYLGKLLIAENLRDVLWTLEFLARQEWVDADRIGCVGLSYGGRMTMTAAALEPRIRVAVIAGALNCYQERIPGGGLAGCQLIPGLLEYGDVPEIGGLIARRPCVWQAGSQDPQIPADWAEKAIQRLRRPYAALGAAEQLIIDRFDGAHEWHGDVAYGVLDRILRG